MLKSITIQARAKINLYLEVVGKRADGCHDIESIFQALELSDEINIEKANSLTFSCDDKDLENLDNLAVKAARVFCAYTGIEPNFKITLKKSIPIAAGLAGGSSDAAAVLSGLMKMTGIALEREELAKLALSVGTDVVYCATGYGLAEVGGKGDIVKVLPDLPKIGVLIIMPGFGISTEHLYGALDAAAAESIGTQTESAPMQPPYRFRGLIEHIESERSWAKIGRHIRNVFEEPAVMLYPELGPMLNKLRELRSLGCGISGTGPALFLLGDENMLFEAKRGLSALDNFTGCSFIVTATAAETIKIVEMIKTAETLTIEDQE